MKKQKFTLASLKVQSFITELPQYWLIHGGPNGGNSIYNNATVQCPSVPSGSLGGSSGGDPNGCPERCPLNTTLNRTC